MVYEEDDDALEFAEEHTDAHIPDKPQDIRVRHKGGGGEGEGEGAGADEDEDGETDWNRRRGSAAALELMAETFPGNVLAELLPLVQQLLQARVR